MFYVLLGAGVAALGWISVLATRHLRADDENADWRQLQRTREQVLAELQEFLRALPSQAPDAAHPPNAHASAAEIYGLINAGKSEEAIAKAELVMAKEAQDPWARMLLVAALRSHGDHGAASAQLGAAEKLGASGSLFAYLETQLEIEQYLAGAGKSPQNAILVPIEMLALELHTRLGSTGDASALWLPGEGGQSGDGGEVSRDEARDFVLAHFGGYYRLIRTMIASQREEEYSDALYLLARLAIKCGFSEEGGGLLMSLEEAMKHSALHKSYLRDLGLLRGEKPIAKEESKSDGKKVIKLKVLN